MSTTEQKPAPWYAAFPPPVSKPDFITREETRKLFETKTVGKDFILVDVRRTDFEGGTIKHSINLPAHSLYQTREAIYNLLRGAGVSLAIFYCSASNGRGPRSSSWLQDYIDAKGDQTIKSVALEGGFKGWITAGEDYVKLAEGYDAEVWAKGGDGR